MKDSRPPASPNSGRHSGQGTALIIGTVWPEVESSAAGVRTQLWVDRLQSWGFAVTFATTAKDHPARARLEAQGVETRTLELNDSAIDPWIKALAPTLVIFDRFVIEEQFGWRVAEQAPDALRVLDMQDFHALRRVRQRAPSPGPLTPVHELAWDTVREELLRELAAIYRSDLTIVISEAESRMLREYFGIAEDRLFTSGFAYPERTTPYAGFTARKHFVMLGNFRHPPNADAIRTARELWPELRRQTAQAQRISESHQRSEAPELHVYGAYPLKDLVELHNPKIGFHIKGPCANAVETLEQYRVQIAPLRFGAGLKGKICDAFFAGTPTVTTAIGAEGIGAIGSESLPAMIERAAHWYTHTESWLDAQAQGAAILRDRFDRRAVDAAAHQALLARLAERDAQRARNWVGAVLSHEAHQSKRYLSLWIEAKNRMAPPPKIS